MKNTIQGLKLDLYRAKDILAIRLINVIDRLRGNYEPVKSNSLHRGNRF